LTYATDKVNASLEILITFYKYLDFLSLTLLNVMSAAFLCATCTKPVVAFIYLAIQG